MATRPASSDEHSITMELPAGSESNVDMATTEEPADAAGGESSALMVTKKLEKLNMIVFYIAFFEWLGNAVGTLASIWATVVLLGGFCSLLNHMDFWFSAIMIFLQASRVFIRKDAMFYQWLFGSTSAFRWEDLSSPLMLDRSLRTKLIVMLIGMSISFIPEDFSPEIDAGIIKVAVLVIISQLLTRDWTGRFARAVLVLLMVAAGVGAIFVSIKRGIDMRSKTKAARLKYFGILFAWLSVTPILLNLSIRSIFLLKRRIRHTPWMGKFVELTFRNKAVQLCFKVNIALGLACFPFLQPVLGEYYRYVSITVSLLVLALGSHCISDDDEILEEEKNISYSLLLRIPHIIMPILCIWSVMFPLPGISLDISFYILFAVIGGVLIGNLQIPVASLQVLLSGLRLGRLLSHHHHDYPALPPDASPQLVPSIVLFFLLELCQGSSYILATILWVISLFPRRSLLRDLKLFKKKWARKALKMYQRQAYQARTEKGLLPSEKSSLSLPSWAIQSLGSTSSEVQIAGLRVLHHLLKQWDSESKRDLITEITSALPTMMDLLSSRVSGYKCIKRAAKIIDELSGGLKISEFPGMLKQISCLLDAKNSNFFLGLSILRNLARDPDNCAEIDKDAKNIITKIIGSISCLTDGKDCCKTQQRKREAFDSLLEFVRSHAIRGGKIGANFRFLLESLEHILDEEGCQPEQRKLVMEIIAKLALDEAAGKEIGNTQSIIDKLMHAFLMPCSKKNDRCSLQMAAGEALANLTIMSRSNCLAILSADPEHNLIENLVSMLEDEYYIHVAADLLHNLCAYSRDKLTDLGANNKHLESALPKVMQIIRTKKSKQLEAALVGSPAPASTEGDGIVN